MIWYALRVVPQKEFLLQRILREKGITSMVPIKYVARRKSRGTINRQLMAYPQMPGLVFIGCEPREHPDWQKLEKLDKIVLGKFTDGAGCPQEFGPADFIRISGHSTRPLMVRKNPSRVRGRRTQRFRTNAEILSGPHEGHVGKAIFVVGKGQDPQQSREVEAFYELLSTGT